MKINENGRSMVEMLGVLAIIGVLSAGGLAGYSKAMFKHKLNNTIDEVTMIVTNIRTMYGTATDYAGLGGTGDGAVNPVALGIVPSNFVATTVTGENTVQSITNPFKGTVTLAADAAKDPGDNQAFTITVGGLPREACVTIASADWGTGAGSGFLGVKYTGHDPLVGGTATYTEKALPVSVAASTVCTATTDSGNSVTLKFY